MATNASAPNTRRRVVILDAMNVMHGSSSPVLITDQAMDIRPNAALLFLLFFKFMTRGYYTIAVFYKKEMHRWERDWINGWIITELNKLGFLKFSNEEFVEADDLCAIRFAQDFEGVIITNDRYANHRKDFPNFDFENRLVQFKVEPNPSFNLANAAKALQCFVHIDCDPSFEWKSVVPADPNSLEYKKLMIAMRGRSPNPHTWNQHYKTVNNMLLYMQHVECLCRGIPSPANFGEFENKTFPFKDFAMFSEHMRECTEPKRDNEAAAIKKVRETMVQTQGEASFDIGSASGQVVSAGNVVEHSTDFPEHSE